MSKPDLLPIHEEKTLKEKFSKIKPLFNVSEAHLEASRCLFCFDAPCIKDCPTSIDIPLFIRQIMTKDLKGAAKTILSQNILGKSCGDVCPTSVLCEGACVYLKLNQKPIEIGRLQAYATNYAIENNIRFFSKSKKTNKKIAIIGGGPAGLSCAHELTVLGYDVTVYEKDENPGGLNTYGVAPYKFTNEDSKKEIEYISKIGFEIKPGIEVVPEVKKKSKDKISLNELERSYDAIFIGLGLGKPKRIKIPGENLKGVYGAAEFIHELREKEQKINVGKNVIVIGGGNTSIDAAVESSLLGANVTVLYRRSEKDQSAYKFEIEHAKKNGVKFIYLTYPLEILGDLWVRSIRCTKKSSVEMVPNSEFELPCDMVIIAIGQEKFLELFNSIKGLKLEDGKIVVNKYFQTSNPKYFAGGDCINGGKEVVNAVADGRDAARGIDKYLSLQAQSLKQPKEING